MGDRVLIKNLQYDLSSVTALHTTWPLGPVV